MENREAAAMIAALLNQKGGVGKPTLALHLAGEWAREGKCVVPIETLPQGSALEWFEQRAKERSPRPFDGIGIARDTLHREPWEFVHSNDHVVIDGPPLIAGLTRSALLAPDLDLIPAQPSALDGWASGEMLKLIDEARIVRVPLTPRFVFNRCAERTLIARETTELLPEYEPPVLAARIGRRVSFADAAQSGRLVFELDETRSATCEISALALEAARLALAPATRSHGSAHLNRRSAGCRPPSSRDG